MTSRGTRRGDSASPPLLIRPLASPDEAEVCARLMAGSEPWVPFTGYIQTVCVEPSRRGLGTGTSLVAWAETRIGRESPNVFLCVSSFNAEARRLYQRPGYRLVGTLTDYLVPGHDELLFRKTSGSWEAFRDRVALVAEFRPPPCDPGMCWDRDIAGPISSFPLMPR